MGVGPQRSARDRGGHLVAIRPGRLEDHIVADVAWAAATYTDWTGDEASAHGPGRELLVETARYWASRIRTEGDGSAHVFGVIGPDEYHEPVDDNTFTNVMARWNLRGAAAAVGDDADPAEVRRRLALADALVDGYDPNTGVYEEFSGFYGLEPVVIADAAPRRPVTADLRRRRDRDRCPRPPDRSPAAGHVAFRRSHDATNRSSFPPRSADPVRPSPSRRGPRRASRDGARAPTCPRPHSGVRPHARRGDDRLSEPE